MVGFSLNARKADLGAVIMLMRLVVLDTDRAIENSFWRMISVMPNVASATTRDKTRTITRVVKY